MNPVFCRIKGFILVPGSEYTVSSNVSLTARYTGLNINLAYDADNGEILYMNDGKKTRSVTITGRTLYKNGDWNTLCLPFNVEITGSPLDGDDVDVRKLESSSYENGVLTPKRPIEPEAVFMQIKYNIQ